MQHKIFFSILFTTSKSSFHVLVLSYTNLSPSLPEDHKQEDKLVDTDTQVTSPDSRKVVSSDSKTSNHPSVKVSAAITKLNHGSS